MNFILKGVTKDETIKSLLPIGVREFSFDLRPRSFNFTQLKNIKEIVILNPAVELFSLCFANEPEHMVSELYLKVSEDLNEKQKLWVEYTGGESLMACEKQGLPYIWHYHPGEKIKHIHDTEYLKRIVFKHSILEEFHQNGELHGFFGLFQDYTEKVMFEIQVDWDTELILSLFDFFQIPMLSFEINQKVELSYQNPDHTLMQKNLVNLANYFANS